VATLPFEEASELQDDLHAMPAEIANGVCPFRVVQADSTWKVWAKFCHSIDTDPGLGTYEDPVPILHLFARQWRDGRIAPAGNPFCAQTAEDAVRQVGQAFSLLGAHDPHRTQIGKIDFRLTRIVAGWKRKDPSPKENA
jgi:hypothetical protein